MKRIMCAADVTSEFAGIKHINEWLDQHPGAELICIHPVAQGTTIFLYAIVDVPEK